MKYILNIDLGVLTLLAGTLVPFAVGLLAKSDASSRVKGILNAVLSALAGGLAVAIAADGQVVLATVVRAMLETFIASTAVYHGLWKPTGAAPAVAKLLPGLVGTGNGAP